MKPEEIKNIMDKTNELLKEPEKCTSVEKEEKSEKMQDSNKTKSEEKVTKKWKLLESAELPKRKIPSAAENQYKILANAVENNNFDLINIIHIDIDYEYEYTQKLIELAVENNNGMILDTIMKKLNYKLTDIELINYVKITLEKDYSSVLKTLIKDKRTYNTNVFEDSILIEASINGANKCIDVLGENENFDINSVRESDGKSAAMVAKNIKTFRQLKKLGINLDIKNKKGEACIHMLNCSYYDEMLDELINSDADLDTLNKNKMSVLTRNIIIENFERAKKIYEAGGCLDVPGESQSALFRASTINEEFALYLADEGADISFVHEESGNNIGINAASNGFRKLVKRLYADGNLCLDYLNNNNQNVLNVTIEFENWDIVEDLTKTTIDLDNEPDNQHPALIELVEEVKFKLAELVVDKGADVNITSIHRNQAFQQGGEREFIHFIIDAFKDKTITAKERCELKNLLDKILEKDIDFNVVDIETEEYPIEYFLKTENLNIIKKMKEKGATLSIEFKDGKYPLSIATSSKDTEIFDYLLECPEIDVKTTGSLFDIEQDPEYHKLQSLVNAGVDIEKTDENGNSYIFNKIHTVKPAEVNILLEAGATLNNPNELGITPFSESLKTIEEISTPVMRKQMKILDYNTLIMYIEKSKNIKIEKVVEKMLISTVDSESIGYDNKVKDFIGALAFEDKYKNNEYVIAVNEALRTELEKPMVKVKTNYLKKQ